MMKKVYITTAIPYVNGAPHVGHVMDYCLADTYARWRRRQGDEVRFQAGTDEHGNKIAKKAAELGVDVREYVAENAEKFRKFIAALEAEPTDFIRTTNVGHERRCQEIWRKLSDHIYKDKYEGWYCSGCERFVTDKEYEENHGECPDHLKPYERLEEENYYFRISDFKEQIEVAIRDREMEILPEFRATEVLRLLEESPDVSISRPRSQLEWGVPVPDDPEQVMYVWIDALSNYITVLGYPDKDNYDFKDWWPAEAQFVGKDILRFHAIIWPAMLLGLGLELPRHIVTHGFILSNGQKMSKSIGNVVDPMEVLERHGAEALRYYFLRHVGTFSDGDFTWEKFEETYNNELANDLGNLVQRLATLVSKNHVKLNLKYDSKRQKYDFLMRKYVRETGRRDYWMWVYDISEAFDEAWRVVQDLNREIDVRKPWELAKNGEKEKLDKCLNDLVSWLLEANELLEPFLPETSRKINEIFAGEVVPPEPLFPKDKK